MKTYLIWSNQRQAWWRPGGAGYTLAIEEAGRYGTEWAQRIIRDATVDGQLVHTRTNPVTGDEYQQLDEALVLAPESEVELARELEECLRELGRLRMQSRGGEGGSIAPRPGDRLMALATPDSLHNADQGDVIEHEGRQLRVIPMDVHDQRCMVRVASAQGTTPEVLHCHFCGFCYPPRTEAEQPSVERIEVGDGRFRVVGMTAGAGALTFDPAEATLRADGMPVGFVLPDGLGAELEELLQTDGYEAVWVRMTEACKQGLPGPLITCLYDRRPHVADAQCVAVTPAPTSEGL